MAGYVRAHLELHGDRSYDVLPISCPAVDEHTAGEVRCFTVHHDGWQRSCMYYVTTTENDNVTARLHPSSLMDAARTASNRRKRCGVICQRQRGNRPPGC